MFYRTFVLSTVLGLISASGFETAQAGVVIGFGTGPGGGFGVGIGRGGSGVYYGSGPYYGYGPYYGSYYGGYGPYYGGYGSYYSGYGPSYYSGGSNATPQYYQEPSYQQPNYSVPGPTVAAPDPRFDGGEIRLFNPKDAPGPVRYGLNGRVFTMRPGEQQIFRFDRQWIITLLDERAGRPAGAEYSLTKGQFKFKMTDRGWDLVEVDDVVAPPSPAEPSPAPPAPAQPEPVTPAPAPAKPAPSTSVEPKPAPALPAPSGTTSPKTIDINPPPKPTDNKPN